MRVILLALLIWSTPILSLGSRTAFCFGACQHILKYVQFSPVSGLKGKLDACSNENHITSLYLCLSVYCTPEDKERGVKEKEEWCERWGNETLPSYDEIVGGYSEEDIEGLHHLETSDIFTDDKVVLDDVAIPSNKLFHLGYDTLDAAHFEHEIHTLYGFVMYYFWVAVIITGITSRLTSALVNCFYKSKTSPQYNESTSSSSLQTLPSFYQTPYVLLKKYITVPATFGFTHAQAIKWCTIPTRIQSITIAAFVILNIVLCSISYRVFADNLYWRPVSTQGWRYLADRTGIISTANLALIWAFGIRNNTLLWLTGWDFAAYNNFHRWVARVATVEAVVHSVAYTVLIFKDGSFKDGWTLYTWYYTQRWFTTGVLATIFMVAICVFSVYGLRRNFYEIFLITHIVLSVLVILTMWYHVEIFHGRYNCYIYPCILIWLSDRALRLIRILLHNPFPWTTQTLVSYDPTSNIVRLAVPHSTAFIAPRPGTFYYLTSLNSLQIWESHPFTLSYATSKYGTPMASPGTFSPRSVELSPIEQDGEFHPLLISDGTGNVPPGSMVFIIRPYYGFTSRLRFSALAGPVYQRMLIDGPYGETRPFHAYDNVLFIVGGTGIAVPLSYLDVILIKTSRTASLKVVWAVREWEFMNDVVSRDFRGHLEDEKVSVTAYVTRASDRDISKDGPVAANVEIQHGRPDIVAEVTEAARDSGNGSLAVVACGPGLMADQTRKAVVDVLGHSRSQIEYFEESFNW